MKTYLLKADSADMDRWKAAAKERGETFASFVRTAIEARSHPLAEPPPPDPRLVSYVTRDGSHFKPDFGSKLGR